MAFKLVWVDKKGGTHTLDEMFHVDHIDDKEGGLVIIDWTHHMLHEGRHFTAHHFEDQANGANIDILIVAPKKNQAHVLWNIEFEGESKIEVYSTPVWTALGTEISGTPNYPDAGITAEMKVYLNPTLSSDGTLRQTWQKGSGSKVGGGTRTDTERILTKGSSTLVRITNMTALDNLTDATFDWYEIEG